MLNDFEILLAQCSIKLSHKNLQTRKTISIFLFKQECPTIYFKHSQSLPVSIRGQTLQTSLFDNDYFKFSNKIYIITILSCSHNAKHSNTNFFTFNERQSIHLVHFLNKTKYKLVPNSPLMQTCRK